MRTRDSGKRDSWTTCSASGPRWPVRPRLVPETPPAAVGRRSPTPTEGDGAVVVAGGLELDPIDQTHHGEAPGGALEPARAARDRHLLDEHREVAVGADGGGVPGERADQRVAVGCGELIGT